jgi:hypothetical protein
LKRLGILLRDGFDSRFLAEIRNLGNWIKDALVKHTGWLSFRRFSSALVKKSWPVVGWRRAGLIAAILLTSWSLAHAASAKLIMSWKNPTYSNQHFHRILVIGMSENPVVRADFEDALSSKITRDGFEAVPGNTILLRPDSSNLDLDYLKGQIQDNKIDAVIVSHLVKVEKKMTYVPGQNYVVPYGYYNGFYGYYGAVYRQVYTPDYLREDTTVRVETNLYSVTPPNEYLVWIGISDSFNPKNADKVISGLVKLVVKQLEKEAILSKSP